MKVIKTSEETQESHMQYCSSLHISLSPISPYTIVNAKAAQHPQIWTNIFQLAT